MAAREGKPRLVTRRDVPALRRRLRRRGLTVVFTNGVFDILHRGHIDYLTRARAMGDVLIVGVNSDASVRRLKGKSRPVQSQGDRAAILLALRAVDYVVLFGEAIPQKLIEEVQPDVLVKGADYRFDEIVGAEFVTAHGGRVRRIPLTRGRSSSKILRKLG
jgi:rfaE bifunctional protein nucleotidyltransferase chain/domain